MQNKNKSRLPKFRKCAKLTKTILALTWFGLNLDFEGNHELCDASPQ